MARILYVEDNDDNIYLLELRLARQGFEVIVARDGAEGVRLTGTAAPDLVLMDLGLPVLDGWEAARRIKADASTRDIPIIALSAHAMSADRTLALEAGCDDYDVKPVEWPRLLGKIRTLLAAAAVRA